MSKRARAAAIVRRRPRTAQRPFWADSSREKPRAGVRRSRTHVFGKGGSGLGSVSCCCWTCCCVWVTEAGTITVGPVGRADSCSSSAARFSSSSAYWLTRALSAAWERPSAMYLRRLARSRRSPDSCGSRPKLTCAPPRTPFPRGSR
jgi:hypothetical protein